VTGGGIEKGRQGKKRNGYFGVSGDLILRISALSGGGGRKEKKDELMRSRNKGGEVKASNLKKGCGGITG